MLYSIKLYIGITTSTFSTLSINIILIFETQEINGALFLKANFPSITWLVFAVLVAVTISSSIIRSNKISYSKHSFNNSNFSCNNNICITVITYICSYHWCFKSYLYVNITWPSRLIINFYPFFSNELRYIIRCCI